MRQRGSDIPLVDRFGQPIAYAAFAMIHRLRWRGAENVPRAGPAILAANHQSFLDPVLIGLAVNRLVVFMAWERYYNMPILGPLMRLHGAVPVNVDQPEPRALAAMLEQLKSGRLCGIFPEGGRNELMGKPKPGVGWLALHSGAPVIPVTICGAWRAWPPGQALPRPMRISLCFGRPVSFSGDPASRSLRRQVTFEVMMRVADGFHQLGRPDLAEQCRRKLQELRQQQPAAG